MHYLVRIGGPDRATRHGVNQDDAGMRSDLDQAPPIMVADYTMLGIAVELPR